MDLVNTILQLLKDGGVGGVGAIFIMCLAVAVIYLWRALGTVRKCNEEFQNQIVQSLNQVNMTFQICQERLQDIEDAIERKFN